MTHRLGFSKIIGSGLILTLGIFYSKIYEKTKIHCSSVQQVANDENKTKTQYTMHPMQRQILETCQKRARVLNAEIFENIKDKFHKLGYTENDLNNAIKYLKNADIVIHFGADIAGVLGQEDSRYKNIFETYKNAHLLLRRIWEENLFGKDCDKLDPMHRVKY